ncbi:MAG: EAL domain-containing protein, partial [Halothiobacillus sp.]|nr:EAL domain-containing protein [Halothiobacillus sp.]
KIDQSFVRDILVDPKDLVIVKAIVAMGHALGLEVVAEGVETMAERDLLDSLGCDSFQGYLVGRPGKPEEISPMLGVGLL